MKRRNAETQKDRVLFRVDEDGHVFALFPDLPMDVAGKYCTSYAHVGQHSGADYAYCIETTRPATQDEYSALASELRGIGYNLDICEA